MRTEEVEYMYYLILVTGYQRRTTQRDHGLLVPVASHRNIQTRSHDFEVLELLCPFPHDQCYVLIQMCSSSLQGPLGGSFLADRHHPSLKTGDTLAFSQSFGTFPVSVDSWRWIALHVQVGVSRFPAGCWESGPIL